MAPFFHKHEFWSSASLRCVLIAEKSPAGYVVQVMQDGVVMAYERCEADEGAVVVAERFRKLFIEP